MRLFVIGKRTLSDENFIGSRPVFSSANEKMLADHVKTMSAMFHGLISRNTSRLTKGILYFNEDMTAFNVVW